MGLRKGAAMVPPILCEVVQSPSSAAVEGAWDGALSLACPHGGEGHRIPSTSRDSTLSSLRQTPESLPSCFCGRGLSATQPAG